MLQSKVCKQRDRNFQIKPKKQIRRVAYKILISKDQFVTLKQKTQTLHLKIQHVLVFNSPPAEQSQ